MNPHAFLPNKVISYIVLISLCLMQKCESLCGNSFSGALAFIVVDGVEEEYTANGCVKDMPLLENFKLISKTDTLQPGTFSNLPTLELLELNNVNIRKVEPGFLDNSSNVHTIKIEQNRLEIIKRNTFEQLSLRGFDVSSNIIREIEDLSFRGTSIEFMSLSNNKLEAINPKWFEDSSVIAFSMTHNLVTKLEDNTFSGIRNMRTINLNYNKIKTIDKRAFSSVQTLQTVYLSGNQLEVADFEIQHSLRNVDLSFNRLSYLFPDQPTPLWIMSVYPNPFECSCLREFWKFTSSRNIDLWNTKSLRRPWRDEYPLCIVKYTTCDPIRQTYDDIKVDYLKKMNFDTLGRSKFRKGDEFIDLGIVN